MHFLCYAFCGLNVLAHLVFFFPFHTSNAYFITLSINLYQALLVRIEWSKTNWKSIQYSNVRSKRKKNVQMKTKTRFVICLIVDIFEARHRIDRTVMYKHSFVSNTQKDHLIFCFGFALCWLSSENNIWEKLLRSAHMNVWT